jgi:hypothetical protein
MSTEKAFEWLGFWAFAITLFYFFVILGAEVYKDVSAVIKHVQRNSKENSHERL